MENQHRKIKGYRELNQSEIDLMNRIKAKGEELQGLLDECRSEDDIEGKNGDELHDAALDEASRWRAIAKTHLQQGLMALVRSVAKPEFF
jgi:hypothetical protein